MAVDRTKYNNFEMLVGRHRGLIRKLCWWRSSGDEVLCDDLVQECYLAIWLHFGSLRADVIVLNPALLTMDAIPANLPRRDFVPYKEPEPLAEGTPAPEWKQIQGML